MEQFKRSSLVFTSSLWWCQFLSIITTFKLHENDKKMHFQSILILFESQIYKMLFFCTFLILMARLKGHPLIWDNPKSLKNIIPALVSYWRNSWNFLEKWNFRKNKSLLSLRRKHYHHGMKFWKNIFRGLNISLVPEELIFFFDFVGNKIYVSKHDLK